MCDWRLDEDRMPPAQADPIGTWWARHPRLRRAASGLSVSIGILLGVFVFAGIIGLVADNWSTWQAHYRHAGGWLLRLDAPGGSPVTVGTHEDRESCEQRRAWDLEQAYRRQGAIPPVSCVPRYQGWRRLYYVLEHTYDPRTRR
jgi:hypothetical protein